MPGLTRRKFLRTVGGATLTSLIGCSENPDQRNPLDDFLLEQMHKMHIPGLSITAVRHGRIVFSQAYGWSNIERQRPMTTTTIQNIGSVAKPVVTTIVMQCIERGMFKIDDDINQYLPAPVRNPNFPDSPITPAQLLTHRSAIADGSSYGHGYQCGKSKVPLQAWIDGYFQPGGAFYNAAENFHDWQPGEQYEYNNVAFALLAYLVQVVTQTEFDRYCRAALFAPLQMNNTSWLLANADEELHATPYAYVADGHIDSPSWGGVELRLISGKQPASDFVGLYPDCVYDHPNFADGFLRSSAADLANFQLMLLDNGRFNGVRVLREESVQHMLSGDGITWSRQQRSGKAEVWGHSGGDPGIGAVFNFRPTQGDGVVVLANTHGASLDGISARLFTALENILD